MLWNIPIGAAARGLIVASLLLASGAAAAQSPCAPAADSLLQIGWRAYRADSLSVAVERFRRARQLCPENLDAQVGLGFGYLRQARLREADSLFRNVLDRNASNADAWEGRAHSSIRLGDTAAGVEAGRRALALAPDNRELRALLNQVSPEWERVPQARQRHATLQVVARTRGRGFEIQSM
jgi:Flp pilus assembly protein TadD